MRSRLIPVTIACLLFMLPGCATPGPASPATGHTDNAAATSADSPLGTGQQAAAVEPAAETTSGSPSPPQEPAAPDDGGPAPAMQPGDRWASYGTAEDGPHYITWTNKRTFVGAETIEFQGTALTTYRFDTVLEYHQRAPAPIAWGNYTEWRRPSDLALLQVHQESHDMREDKRDAYDTLYDAPCIEMRWPLAAGASWDTHCQATATRHEDSYRGPAGTWRITRAEHRVVGDLEQVTVPAGTFQGYRMEVTMGTELPTTHAEWFAESACAVVRSVWDESKSQQERLHQFQCSA